MVNVEKARPILLIDDSPDIRDVFKVWIELEGYEIRTVPTATEGLGLLRGGLEPCLVLVDLSMPVMNGTEFVEKVQAEGLVQSTPIYLFSAHHMIQPIAGTAGVIRKPFDIEQVLSILSDLNPPCQPLVTSS